ncbi:MAG: glutathione peroxidase [Saprospiraceae bacterium]|nr:glutathione peroxidase [Saprospiraceae bacterium]
MASLAINNPPKSIHEFQIQALDSDEIIDFSDYKGKKILVVNVASKCGFTYQYEDLEKLYQQYKDQLVIVGFPCNQFLGQEPGSEEKIAQFCSTQYGVSFPMTTKVNVKGKDAHPIYQWLTKKELNGKDNYKISWNFNKFLLDENGQILDYFGSRTKPLDESITKYFQ